MARERPIRPKKAIERLISSEPKGAGEGLLQGVAQRARDLPVEKQAPRIVDWAVLDLPRRIRCHLYDHEIHNPAAWDALSSTMGWFVKKPAYVLLVALSGSGVLGVEDEVFTLEEGEACLLPAHRVHYFLRIPPDFEWLSIAFEFDEGAESESLAALSGQPRGVSRKCRRLLNQFLGTFLKSSSAREALDVALALRDLLQEFQDAEVGIRPIPELNLVEKTRAAAIQQREGESDLEALAAKMEMSSSDLKREFEISGGVILASFVRSVRLTHAAALLVETALTPEEVSTRCGFRSLDSFEQHFDDHFRVSPEKYRASRKRPA